MEMLPELGEVKVIKESGWTRRYNGYWPENYPDGAPACTHPDGSYEYWEERMFHRDPNEGPAAEYRHRDEKTDKEVRHVEYRWHGNLHRLDGPACWREGDWGKMVKEQTVIYAFHGIPVPEEWTQGRLTKKKILESSANETVQEIGLRVWRVLRGKEPEDWTKSKTLEDGRLVKWGWSGSRYFIDVYESGEENAKRVPGYSMTQFGNEVYYNEMFKALKRVGITKKEAISFESVPA